MSVTFVYPGGLGVSSPRLGRVQMRIVQVLWRKGRASAREITEALRRREPIAHSTVQTLLRKLEAKGAVAHDVEDRTFVFYPLVKEEAVRQGAARELMDRVFEGSAAGLVTYLLENERVSEEELAEIRRLIAEKDSK
jgi:BlaI family penicillinase repressor